MQIRKLNFKYIIVLAGLLVLPFCSVAQTIYAKADAKYDGIKRIEIEGRFTDVNIIGEDRDDVQFKGLIQGKIRGSKDFEIKHRQDGSTLKVWVETPGFISGRFDAYLNFKVPYSTDIEIINSSGDVYVEDIISDKMRLKASSGDIELKNIETNLTSTTSSGDLKIDYLKGSISAVSTSGDQNFSHIQADISTSATSGDMSFIDVKGNLSTKTTSGDLKFEDINGALSNVSSSGNFTIKNAKTVLDLMATSGDIRGEGIELLADSKFTSTSGDITMDFENEMDALSFDLRASSGDLHAGQRSAERKLYAKHGEIWVYGHSTSGDQSYH
ncbi:hypothetical protein EO244_01795 [Ancylomarina salipaludis]|uniref:DUF4097 domain-containing protein n=1 Tax=Ancylomarina salipaludis TaxID=2501299 RepID=A0A4Q1JRR3_9BACT|nr:DUF4097 family beta strand repeat-containing protein [Ancylomarina salipaludis]RXQ97640.1 hypothetical protein EO244_01795 [Ancylomarina salipaludis]